jgi:hypothetical protein
VGQLLVGPTKFWKKIKEHCSFRLNSGWPKFKTGEAAPWRTSGGGGS